jgi:hypothetical protein
VEATGQYELENKLLFCETSKGDGVAGLNRYIGKLDQEQIGVVSFKGDVEDIKHALLEFDRQLLL